MGAIFVSDVEVLNSAEDGGIGLVEDLTHFAWFYQ
jgi:hypothetical protein